jgi:hypothetical protein
MSDAVSARLQTTSFGAQSSRAERSFSGVPGPVGSSRVPSLAMGRRQAFWAVVGPRLGSQTGRPQVLVTGRSDCRRNTSSALNPTDFERTVRCLRTAGSNGSGHFLTNQVLRRPAVILQPHLVNPPRRALGEHPRRRLPRGAVGAAGSPRPRAGAVTGYRCAPHRLEGAEGSGRLRLEELQHLRVDHIRVRGGQTVG